MAHLMPLLLLTLSLATFAAPDASKLVPGGKIITQTKDKLKIGTMAGTAVELILDMEGELEEASGSAAEKGDIFEPGQKLISLKSAVEGMRKLNKTLQGEWIFEENEEGDWIYDFEGQEKGTAVDFIVHATSGKLIKTEADE